MTTGAFVFYLDGTLVQTGDSPAGVAAALAAGMSCVAVSTPFTRAALHDSGLLDPRWIVDDPAELLATVAARSSTTSDS